MKSNKEFKKKIAEFFQEANAALIRSQSKFRSVLQSKNFWMHNGLAFEVTDRFASTLGDVVAGVIKFLGSNKVNEKQIKEIAMDVATSSSSDKTKDFITAVETEVARTYERIEPCYAVLLNRSSPLKLGRVTIEDASNVASQLNKPDGRWRIEPNARPRFEVEGNTFVVGLPRCVWRVTVECFKGNVRDEAAWYIDLAVSLLRLSIPPGKRVGNFPRNGFGETPPTEPPNRQDHGITLSSTGTSLGGSSLDGWYEITSRTFTTKKRQKLEATAALLMNPKRNSVAERFANGLGWLSRGRRASDQAERFLSFFTAIESLLTRQDKNAPVTDTICRSVACILGKKGAHRAQIAKRMAGLYATRSILVHAGERLVSEADSAELQLSAELIFFNVMRKVDLNKPLDDFHNELKAASYGGAWP